MPIHVGRTDIREAKAQSDGEQVFPIGEDIEIIQIIPMLTRGPATGTLEVYIKTCQDSEWEPLFSPYTHQIETIDLANPTSIKFSAWVEFIKIVPINVVGQYDIIIKKGYR